MRPAWLDGLRRGGLIVTALLYSAGYGVWGLSLLLVAALTEADVTRRLPWARTRVDLFLAAFLAAFLISGILSPYRPVATGSVGLAAVTIFLAFGSTAGVLKRDPSFLRPLVTAWVVGAVGAAVWGVVLRRIAGGAAFTPELGRNALGTALLIGTILSLGLVLERRGGPRYLAAVGVFILLAGLVLTYTRGAWLGALVGAVLLLGLAGVRKLVAGIAAAALLVAVGLALVGSERAALISRAASIPDLSANQDRLLLIRTSLAIFAAYPVSGTGLNTFSLVYPAFRLPNDRNPLPLPFAHNIFVNMAAEGGILGFATFLAIVLVGVYGGWRWHRARGPEQVTAATVLAAFVGAIVHQVFDGTLLSVHLGLGLWVLLAILGVGWTRAAEPVTDRRWTSA